MLPSKETRLADLRQLPIAPWEEPPNWARLPIRECREALVPIPVGDATNLSIRPMYAEAGIPGASADILVRAGIAARLVSAGERLAAYGVGLCVFDGYRPLSVQRYLYESFAADLRVRHPDLSDPELTALLRQYVASPSADPACPPPHRTGAAVDVYPIDWATGQPLPMGTDADEAVAASATRHFESSPVEPFTGNRRLLFHAMIDAGFTNYGGEWWHYDWGNQRWANVARAEAAIYGVADEK